jgi:hypothetical protein
MVQDHEVRVPDRRLITLVGLAAVFSAGPTADHVVRGDLPWPLTAASVPFILINLTLYGSVGVGLSLYVQNKVGPPARCRRRRAWQSRRAVGSTRTRPAAIGP